MSKPTTPASGRNTPLTPRTEEEVYWCAAQTAFDAKRYNDSIRFFNELIKVQPRLSKTQKELLASAYKKLISSPRDALRIVTEEMSNYLKKQDSEIVNRLDSIEKSLKSEISKIANNILELIDTKLLVVTTDAQSIVFYNKLRGDYYRYLAEINPTDDTNLSRARASYESAMKSVNDDMKMADPVYLRLVLNYCVFQNELLDMKSEAIDRADATFNEAVRYLDELDENEYAEATIILQLMRDNIAIWREEQNEQMQNF